MKLNNLPFLLPSCAESKVISEDVQVNPDKLQNGIRLFREWLQCEKHLPHNIDEVLIRNFLYGCKGNLEVAKNKFEKYVVNRTTLTQLFNDREVRIEIIQPWGLHRMMYVAPKLTPEGYRIFLIRLPTADSTHFDCIEAYKRLILNFDLHVFNDENAGYEFIYDTKNFSMGILGKVNLTLTYRLLQMIYTILPFRIKAIHIVNTTPAMDIIVNMAMKILSKKMKERLHHRRADELVQCLPKECLPNEYGGTAGEFDVLCDRYNNFLMENSKWIKDTEELKLAGPIPEHKKGLYSFEEFSMDGSFRKLNID